VARILVVDDAADIRSLLIRILNRDGHSITEAADGESAFHLLMTERFDIAVLDVMMPKLDGLTLCRMLRDTPGLGPLGLVCAMMKLSARAAWPATRGGARPGRPTSLLRRLRLCLPMRRTDNLQRRLSCHVSNHAEECIHRERLSEECIRSLMVMLRHLIMAGHHDNRNPSLR
jgi:two-component system response regulator MprA